MLPFQGDAHLTMAAYRGIRGVTASSSVAFADAVGGSDPSGLPFAAVDGDPLTAWQSSSFTGPAGQWLEVELDTPREVPYVNLSVVDDIRVGWPVTRVRLTTDAGSVEREVGVGDEPQRFPLPAGVTGRVRVTVLVGRGEPGERQRRHRRDGDPRRSTPHRALVAPADAMPAMNQDGGLRVHPRLAAEVRVRRREVRRGAHRAPARSRSGVHRLFTTTSASNYRLEGTVLPALGGRNPVSLPGVAVSASSQLAGDPTAGALSAVDGGGDRVAAGRARPPPDAAAVVGDAAGAHRACG